MKKIYLAMIVKNEGARIARALRSAAPILAGGFITDTGSTDNTLEEIEKVGKEFGITFSTLQTEFKNFEQARNDNLLAAKAAIVATVPSHQHIDCYLLLMDADMELQITPAFKPEELTAAMYYVAQKQSGLTYQNQRLLQVTAPAKYVGVTHEYLSVEGTAQPLDTLWFLDHGDGANRKDKFTRDISLLTTELKGGTTPRYLFYLAQSYKDSGKYAEAIVCYDARILLGGWDEEVWYSWYKSAECCLKLGQDAEFIRRACKACDFRAHRAETWLMLSTYYRERGNNTLAHMYAQRALIANPRKDMLFVELDAYTWKPRYEIALSGYYVADDAIRKSAAREAVALLTYPGVPQNYVENIRHNASYSIVPASVLFPGVKMKALKFGLTVPGWEEANSSIANHPDGNFEWLVRVINYKWQSADVIWSSSITPGEKICSRNGYARLDTSLNVLSVVPVQADKLPPPPFHGKWVDGFEDLRIFRHHDKLCAIAMSMQYNPEGQLCGQVYLEIDEKTGDITKVLPLPFPEQRLQKNWAPVIGHPDVLVVYSWWPFVVYKINTETGGLTMHKKYDPVRDLRQWKGSSQLIPYKDGWICVVHETVDFRNRRRQYWHRFAWLDKDLTVQSYTDPFNFLNSGIQFCCGIAETLNNFILSISIVDRDPAALIIPKLEVDAQLHPI